MKVHWLAWALCAFIFITGKTYAQTRHDLIGIWHDELKATISITGVSHTGQLTGTYISPDAGPHQFFQLTGWVSPVIPSSKGSYSTHDVYRTVESLWQPHRLDGVSWKSKGWYAFYNDDLECCSCRIGS